MPTYSTEVNRMTTRRSFDLLLQTITNDSSGAISMTGKSTSVTIYTGAQPTAQVIESNKTNYNQSASACLAHYSTGPACLWNEGKLTYYFTNTSNTVTTNAFKSGTAAWAIIWNATAVNVNVEELPYSGRFIVVPVTTNTGTGIIRYTNLTTTLG